MLIAFFRISRCRLRYSISLCCCRISAAIWAGLCSCALISADGCRLRYCFFHRFRLYSLTSSSPATCRCVFPPWISSSTAWRLNSSLYLRAILLFTVAFILLCALVSAQLGEVQHDAAIGIGEMALACRIGPGGSRRFGFLTTTPVILFPPRFFLFILGFFGRKLLSVAFFQWLPCGF